MVGIESIPVKNIDDSSKIARLLLKKNICTKCIFRYLNVVLNDILDRIVRSNEISSEKNTVGNDNDSLASDSEVSSKPKFKSNNSSSLPCRCCLGILQLLDDQEVLKKMMNAFKNTGYNFVTYLMTLSMPISLQLRHYQMWYYLQDQFPHIESLKEKANSADIPEIKEVFKWIIGYGIKKELDFNFMFGSRFEIRLLIHHPETQLDCIVLAPGITPKEYLRKMNKENDFLRLSKPHIIIKRNHDEKKIDNSENKCLEQSEIQIKAKESNSILDENNNNNNNLDNNNNNNNLDNNLDNNNNNNLDNNNNNESYNIDVHDLQNNSQNHTTFEPNKNLKKRISDQPITNHPTKRSKPHDCPSISIASVSVKLRKIEKNDLLKLIIKSNTFEESIQSKDESLSVCNSNPDLIKFPCPPPINTYCTFNFSFYHLSSFVAGRYCKYSRNVSQSPWLVEGSDKEICSVSEIIGNVLKKHFQSDDCKFMASGREDIDVRMLGNGRPFIMEMIDPRRSHFTAEEISKIQCKINNFSPEKLFVQDLQIVTEKDVKILKNGEETKVKSYRCVVWAPMISKEKIKSLSELEPFTIDQLTPVRVLHRRSLLRRKRTIHKISGRVLNDHYAILDLTTQAGTYIKEFIHSDLGRTKPSFCDLIDQEEADIILLDVTNVDLDFPRNLNSEQKSSYQLPPIESELDLEKVVPEMRVLDKHIEDTDD